VVAAFAAVGLAVGAFVLAFGSGSAGAVNLQGGSSLDAVASDRPGGVVAPSAGASGRLLVVEIVGAVAHPGVYRLPVDSRVGDLVSGAGGFGARVDAGRAARELNLAAPLHDGEQVRVPSRDDVASAATASVGPAHGAVPGTAPPAPGQPISLNRATASELDTLPGIGPATTAKIIASREERPFGSVDELRTRKLVGEKTFEKLKALVAVP
jgi:competence protein ComEA